MTRRRFRYVPYALVQDPMAEPEYAAHCVSGDEADCGAESGVRHELATVEEWQRRHTQETRHTRYRRTFADYAVMEPREGPEVPEIPEVSEALPPGLEPSRMTRARAS